MSIVRMIKRFASLVRMRFCKHDFVLMDTEYNKVSKRYGCGYLWYRCPKCGKMFRTGVDTSRHRDYYRGWQELMKKRM